MVDFSFVDTILMRLFEVNYLDCFLLLLFFERVLEENLLEMNKNRKTVFRQSQERVQIIELKIIHQEKRKRKKRKEREKRVKVVLKMEELRLGLELD